MYTESNNGLHPSPQIIPLTHPRYHPLPYDSPGDRNTWVIEKKNYVAKIEETESKCADRIKDMQVW